ncbi:hypothetical protein TorRG33x02_344600 [Trema orientale]|uniref:Uncharacterized protein n=1 Tax=Trema orientale TaxID=63057 RepID=A0A2P5APZ4_TREOI|nr:hypothetical protein TorRG33x02_344600 [Trema orientale]
MSCLIVIPSNSEKAVYGLQLKRIKEEIGMCNKEMTLLNEQIEIDEGFIKMELENGNLGRVLNFRRRKDHREYILHSYFDQSLAVVKELKELKDRWCAKYGAPFRWRRWDN